MPVAITSYKDTVQQIMAAATRRLGKYVCVSNVHMCMEAFDSPEFNAVVNNADLVIPDGVPLVWGLKALGENTATQVRGSNLLLHLCTEAEKSGTPIGLYGGTPESLLDFERFLQRKYPALQIFFSRSPPFRELTKAEKDRYAEEINQSEARILFVGIGCPKQEKWMAEHQGKLSCVMIGVGAAFDFLSGKKKTAPLWMQKNGLEWLYRLASDPRRLWKRYLKHNPRFVYHFVKQLVKQRLLNHDARKV